MKATEQLNHLDKINQKIGYDLVHAGDNYAEIAQRIPGNTRTIVGIDGPTNSGKTSLSNALAEYYRTNGLTAVILPVDIFLQPRSIRNAISKKIIQGEIPISDYSLLAWEQPRIEQTLLELQNILQKDSGSHTLTITHAYNRQSGRKDAEIKISIDPASVLIVEGVGIFKYQGRFFDVSIQTYVETLTVLFERVLRREATKPTMDKLDPTFLDSRFRLIDIPHSEFLKENTLLLPDYLLDTTKTDTMRLYRKRGSNYGKMETSSPEAGLR